MQAEKAITETFAQLKQVLTQLTDEEYTAQAVILNGASIGQHCRHLLEVYVCLDAGYNTGQVNYENRNRDKLIEQSKEAALQCAEGIMAGLNKPEKKLTVLASYLPDNPETEEYNTTYKRELAYALEHAVHHMALIGVAIKVVAPQITVPQNFGVASSTVKYRKVMAG